MSLLISCGSSDKNNKKPINDNPNAVLVESEKKWEECGAYTWDGENKITANFNFPTIFLRNTNLDKDFFNLFLKDSKKIEDWSIYYPQLYEEEKKYINSLQ